MNSAITKTVTSLALVALLGLGATACAGEPASEAQETDSQASAEPEKHEEAPEPVDLTGEWKQTNLNSEDSFQTATITGDTIEVYWNAPDMKALYWAGTVEVPEDGSTSFSWESVNDSAKTEASMMASEDPTKTFTVKDGEISYEVTAMGTTVTVRLAQQ